jgi:hypothetical protein
MHPLIQFQHDNKSFIARVLAAVFAGTRLNPVAFKCLSGRKHVSKEAISSAEQKVERVRQSAADCSILPTREDSLFLHQNDYWVIRYHGQDTLLKSTRGLHCLAVLLREPRREFHVSELVATFRKAPIPASGVTARGRLRAVGDQLVAAGFSDAGPVLDAEAKAQYKRRLNDLRQDLSEAEKFNDLGRAAKAQDEMHAIALHLASAVGLGGRDRKTSSDAERARSAVTKCVKNAIQKVGDAIPSLGHHLAARIKTGYFCSYNPHPDRPVCWKF